MKKVKSLLCLIFSLLLAFSFSISVFADSYIQAWQSEDAMYGFDSFVKSVQSDCSDKTDIKLYPGGMPFGVRIISKGLYVVGFPLFYLFLVGDAQGLFGRIYLIKRNYTEYTGR